MANIITTIVGKPKWDEKINDPVIKEKWRREFIEQGASEKIVNAAFEVLAGYHERSKPDDDDDFGGDELEEYDWFCKTSFNSDDIFDEEFCKCKCAVCEERYVEEEEPCSCVEECARQRLKFLKTFAREYFGLIDARTASEFKRLVTALPHNRFHPNSNNMSVDVVHPSWNCYVNGVTVVDDEDKPDKDAESIDGVSRDNSSKGESNEVGKDGEEEEEDALFQWLPTNCSVDEEGNVKFDSYINNLDPANTEMYACLAAILKRFVQPFRDCLDHVKATGHIEESSALEKFQVIVKIQELQLTPEKPSFDEGSWHLEGTTAECIVATGIYYYHMENVEQTHLAFKAFINEGLQMPQDRQKWTDNHYCLDRGEFGEEDDLNYTSCMHLGSIPTVQDLCLVFPNIMQHKVSPVRLKDASKLGSRKILVFWLIDPSREIVSTSEVKQQNLPENEARQYVELLMHQRKYIVNEQNDIFERTFALCEH